MSQAGSDANDCSFGSPCLTFSRATQPLAEGGEINAQTDGNFGEFGIDKGMTVDGRGHSVSITAFGNVLARRVHADRPHLADRGVQDGEPRP